MVIICGTLIVSCCFNSSTKTSWTLAFVFPSPYHYWESDPKMFNGQCSCYFSTDRLARHAVQEFWKLEPIKYPVFLATSYSVVSFAYDSHVYPMIISSYRYTDEKQHMSLFSWEILNIITISLNMQLDVLTLLVHKE